MKKLLSALLALLLSFGALAEHMGAPYEFRNSSVTNARIASGVTEIAEGAYYYCKDLQTLEVPATVTKIGDYAFDHCENLTELTVPNSVREIGECAFNYCMRIANLDLGNGVKTLENYAFSCCFSLRQATIPQSVTHIGDYAFYNCRALDTLYIYSSVQTIGVSALEGCPRLTVYTPATSPAAAYCTQNGIKWVAIEEPAYPNYSSSEASSIGETHPSTDSVEDSTKDQATFDDYIRKVNQIDRAKLESWLGNTDFPQSGYLLLEQMMDENGDFLSNRIAYDVMSIGTDLLHLDVLGIGMHIAGEFNADHEIEKILLTSYANYISTLNEDIRIQNQNQEFVGILIDHISRISELSEDFADDLKALDKNLSYAGALSDLYKAHPSKINKVAALARNFYVNEANYLLVHHGSKEEYNKLLNQFYDELADWEKDLPRLRQNYSHVQEVLSGAGSIASGLKAGISYIDSYNKYSYIFDYIIVVQSDFIDMLDSYLEAAESTQKTEYIQAITQFRDDLYDASRKRIIGLSLQDNMADFTGIISSAVKDTIIYIADKNNFKIMPKWVESLKSNKGFVVADLIGYAFDILFWIGNYSEQAELLDQMVYIRDLKEILAENIRVLLREFNGTDSEARAILAGIDFMKQLKYSGEEAALNLCKHLTTVYQYNKTRPEQWKVAFKSPSNTWYISTIGVSPMSTAAIIMHNTLNELGYTAKLLKFTSAKSMAGTTVPTVVLDVNSNRIIAYKDYLSTVKNAHAMLNTSYYIGFRSSAMLSPSLLYDIQDAQAIYQSELKKLESELERLQAKHRDNPEYYDWWENYVDTVSKPKIEMNLY